MLEKKARPMKYLKCGIKAIEFSYFRRVVVIFVGWFSSGAVSYCFKDPLDADVEKKKIK